MLNVVGVYVCSPRADNQKSLKALLFDSWYDQFRGVIANIAVCDGVIRQGM
jgi:GTP-binding protein LepA